MATLADLLIKIRINDDAVRKGVGKTADTVSKGFGKLNDIAGTAIRTMAGMSSVIPLAAGAAGGMISVGVAFASAGAAAGVFGAVVKSTMGDVSENATKVEDLTEKIRLYGREAELAGKYGLDQNKILDKQAKAMLELEARLSLLPPAERAATMEFINMKNSWSDFVDNNKPQTFGILSRGYALIKKVVAELQPLYDMGAKAAGRLLDRMHRLVDGGFMDRLAARAGPALESITSIIINLGTTFSNVFGKISDKQGPAVLEWLEKLTAKWAAWTSDSSENSGMTKMVNYITENGPRTVSLLGDLATAAGNIAQALFPLAPITMAVAGAAAKLVAAIPPEWLTAIVAGFVAYNVALKLYAIYQAAATIAQWKFVAALLASPITWVVLAIVALIAIIVLIATKTKWFQNIWKAVWGFLKAVGAWFAGPFANFFVAAYNKIVAGLTSLKNGAMQRVNAVKAIFTGLWNNWKENVAKIIAKALSLVQYFQKLPGRLAGSLGRMFSGLWNGFRGVANRIIGGWNRLSFTLGGGSVLGVSIPSITLDTPNIPYLADGGIVTGPTLAMIGEGGEDEAVVPLSRMPELAGRDSPVIVVEIAPGGEPEFRKWIKKTIRVKGAIVAGGAAA
jgi:hypothetical protein